MEEKIQGEKQQVNSDAQVNLLKEPREYRIVSIIAFALAVILYFMLESAASSTYVTAALIFLRIAIVFTVLCFVFTMIQKRKVKTYDHPEEKHPNYDFYGNLYHLFICLFLVFFILSIVLRYVYPVNP